MSPASRQSALVLIAGLALASSRAEASGLDTLRAYAGTWTTHIVHYKTAYSKPRTDTDTLRNVCWQSGRYFACDQRVRGASADLIVFTYDRAHAVYHTYPVGTDGKAAGFGTLRIRSNTWVYPWQERDGKKVVYLRILNTFTDSKTIRFREEFSLDRRHWTLAAAGTERRIAR